MTAPMGDESQPRPLSGEIVTRDAQPRRDAPAAGEVIDADYVTVESDGPAAPPWASAPAAAPPPRTGLDMLRREAGPQASRAARAGMGFWAFGLALAAAAFWISGGHALVRQWPAPLAAEAPNPLRIETFRSQIEGRGARAVLLVDGEIANDGAETRAAPPLAIAVADGRGRVTRYILGTNGAPIAPGGRFAFSSRLAAPKEGGASVSVTFEDQTD